jgi:holo-[acyl-carrier protein] synthase
VSAEQSVEKPGIGVDILHIPRIAAILEGPHRESFIRRVFSEAEITAAEASADRTRAYATRFAAKEAVFKSLGTSWAERDELLDIEIDASPVGAPTVHLHGRFALLAAKHHVQTCALSISEDTDYAIAVALPVTQR